MSSPKSLSLAYEIESDLIADLRLELSRADTRLFRNSVGFGYNRTARGLIPLRYGLCVGSGDLIGVKRYRIKPDDVGCVVGVFVSLEAKSRRGVVKKQQQSWGQMVRDFGGIHATPRSVEDARGAIEAWRPQL